MTDSDLTQMSAADLHARACRHAASGNFEAATAFAALAHTAYAAHMLSVSQPPAIHPGDHEPQRVPWCGKCRAPHSRSIRGRRCAVCSVDSLRARRCRYCDVYLEERHQEQTGTTRWVDAHNTIGCPKAPDPALPAPEPEPEEDIYPEEFWREFLSVWAGGRHGKPVTAQQLVDDSTLSSLLPRTRYGEVHPVHLDRWLAARAGRDQHGVTIRPVPGQSSEEPRLWEAAKEAPAP